MQVEDPLYSVSELCSVSFPKEPLFDDEEGDEEAGPKQRPQERKAARAGKEAMKQLHSETQRLVRGQFVFTFILQWCLYVVCCCVPQCFVST